MQLRKPMKKSSISPTWNKDVEAIRELAPPPPEEAIYPYLKAVYLRARKLGQIDEPKEKELNKIANRYPKQIKFGRFRLVIELTASEHMTPKMKWKYTRALQYANQRDINTAKVIAFIKTEGGINECVKKYKPE